jgi:hypothetical protein
MSPKHLDDTQVNKEIIMKIGIIHKLAAFAIAMSINGLILGSVAYLFDGKSHGQELSLAQTSAPVTASVRF